MEIHRFRARGDESLTLEAALDRMVLAHSAEMVWNEALAYFEGAGFDRVIYADMTGQPPLLLTSFPEAFGAYYADVCNPADDPFFKYCCASLIPIATGSDYLDQYQYLTPSERRVIETAREAGMRAGFSCTFQPLSPEGMGGWNIGSTLGRTQVESILTEKAPSLRLVALYAHERMARLRQHRVAEPAIRLSAREHDCLAYLAAGMKCQQIADALGIKPVTVELHLRRARERLGARTREQALAIALSANLLRL